jgi:hypothetical protein
MEIKWRVHEILPKTENTDKKKALQEAERNAKKADEERKLKAIRDQEMKNLKMKAEKDKQRELEEKRKRDEARKREEELAEISSLKGRFGNMINQLNADYTPLEYSISGMQLKPRQIRLLVKVAESNKTLRCLAMSRKGLSDDDGVEIAKCLCNNSVLEKVDLDGNNLGPRCLHEFSRMLIVNQKIRSIDLESNNLTQMHKDNNGILALAEALKKNTTLLSLNLMNCNLDATCSAALADALEVNKTLIMLEIAGNPEMFYKDVRRIQESLVRNKAEYDKERFKEFVERKRAKMEEDNIILLRQEEEETKMAKELIHQRVDDMERKRAKGFQDRLDREEEERRKMIEKLEKEAKIRAGAKNKRRKPKKKKK